MHLGIGAKLILRPDLVDARQGFDLDRAASLAMLGLPPRVEIDVDFVTFLDGHGLTGRQLEAPAGSVAVGLVRERAHT